MDASDEAAERRSGWLFAAVAFQLAVALTIGGTARPLNVLVCFLASLPTLALLLLGLRQRPADGLNRGFARATGDIFYYLNSDDLALPGAFARMAGWFARHPGTDVACGHAQVIDENGTVIRRVWSEPYKRYAVATGAHVQIQPATFIRAEAYRRSGGFDPGDRGNWDGGLLTSLYLAGARIETIDDFLGCYRLHADSITMSGRLAERHHANALRNFERLMGRPMTASDRLAARALRLRKHLLHPLRTLERLRKGPLFRSA